MTPAEFMGQLTEAEQWTARAYLRFSIPGFHVMHGEPHTTTDLPLIRKLADAGYLRFELQEDHRGPGPTGFWSEDPIEGREHKGKIAFFPTELTKPTLDLVDEHHPRFFIQQSRYHGDHAFGVF